MKFEKALILVGIVTLLQACVTLPDLNPFNPDNDMTVVPANIGLVNDFGLNVSLPLIYQGSEQATINIYYDHPETKIEIVSVANGNGKILSDPLNNRSSDRSLKAKLLRPQALAGAVVLGAEWRGNAWLYSSLCHIQTGGFPCFEMICFDPGYQYNDCPFDLGYLAFQARFNDGIHYGWIQLERNQPNNTVEYITGYAFNNSPGEGVRMGEL